jgi:putative peptidoglycan binding protein
VLVSFIPPHDLQKIKSARSQAESGWRSAQDAWNRQDGNKRFLELRNEAQTNVRLLTGLPEEERRALQQLESKKRDNQLRLFLERFDISSARIRKIGSGRKVVLASHGIETAADVEEYRIQAVPGFGPTLTSELITWRRNLEGKFVFNPREQVNPADIAAVKAAVVARKADLEKRLRSGVVNLQQAATYARDLRTTLARAGQHAFAQLKQIELDELKATGIFYKPMKAISIFCAVVGILSAGSWAQVSKTTNSSGQLSKVEVEDKSSRSPPAPLQKEVNRQPSPKPPTTDVQPTKPPMTMPRQAETPTQKSSKPSDPSTSTASRIPTPTGPAGGPFIPVPSNIPTNPTVAPPLNAPIDIEKPPQNSQSSSGDRLFDLAQPKDAERAQQRLIELGYLFGTADGVWGPRSRKALQDFRSDQGFGDRDTWDLQTQQKLFSTMAARRPTAAGDSETTFIGGWGIDPEQCRQATSARPPMTISTRRAEAFGAVCEFVSTQRESTNAWRMQAACTHNGERWSANIRLTVLGDKLTWSNERGTANYVRCVGPVALPPVRP